MVHEEKSKSVIMNQTCSTAGCNGYREPSAQELANRQRDEKAWTAQNQAQNEALDIQRRERERVEREADAQRKPIEVSLSFLSFCFLI